MKTLDLVILIEISLGNKVFAIFPIGIETVFLKMI